MHGISEAEWLAYVDGGLAAAGRARIQAHLRGCADCRRMAGELSMSHSILVEQAGRLVRELEISPAHAARIVSAAMTRIQNAGRGGVGVEEWVGELRSALTPICGSAMADISMRRAAYEAAQSTVDALTETDWEDFVSHLSSHVASLCGRAAGSLIARTGAQIGMETTA